MRAKIYNKIGSNLRYLRGLKRMSQNELALAVGLKRGNIASYEGKSAEPSASNLVRIAKYFNVDLVKMIEEDFETSIEQDFYLPLPDEEGALSSLQGMLEFSSDDLFEFKQKSLEMKQILDGVKLFYRFKKEGYKDISSDLSALSSEFEKLIEITDNLIEYNKKFGDKINLDEEG